MNLELTDLARLASQQAPGSLLSLPFQNWRLQIYEAWPAFNICVLGLQNLGPHAYKTSPLPVAASPQPLDLEFYDITGYHQSIGSRSHRKEEVT